MLGGLRFPQKQNQWLSRCGKQFDFDDLNTLEIRLDSAGVDSARLERGRLNEWPPLDWRH